MNIATLERQVKGAGVAFVRLNRVQEKDFEFELLIDCARMDMMEAYALLAAAFAAGRLDINPVRIVFA